MNIRSIIIPESVLDKLQWKHSVSGREVQEIFDGKPKIRKVERGNVSGEDLYAALGQTEFGRYLVVYFIYKLTTDALVISAREMDEHEKRSYGKKK